MFLTKHLPQWIAAISCPNISKELSETIYLAGTDLLLYPEALRSDTSPTDPIFLAFKTARETTGAGGMALLPRIFSSFLSSLRGHRSGLPSASTNGGTREEQNAYGIKWLIACHETLGTENSTSLSFWQARLHLLEVVEETQLLHSPEARRTPLLSQITFQAVTTLETQKGQFNTRRSLLQNQTFYSI